MTADVLILTKDMQKNNVFNGDLFAFRVGPGLEKFTAHEEIVGRQSDTLRKLMTGLFNENVVRQADIDKVEPHTFDNFLIYAYFVSSRSDQCEIELPRAQKVCESGVVELLLDQQHKHFVCKGCCEKIEIRFAGSIPFCEQCMSDHRCMNWSTRCIVQGCGQEARYIRGWLCETCMKKLKLAGSWGHVNTEALASLTYEKPVSLKEVHAFWFDIPNRALEMLGRGSNRILSFIPNNLLDTVKLAVFADTYMCPKLLTDAVEELYLRLANAKLDEENITLISECIRLVYESTINETSDSMVTEHKTLRSMLSEFVATHVEQFLASPTFTDLLSKGGDLPRDVLTAISKLRGYLHLRL